ncbi:MAG: hypothetical protein A4S08_03320 [Proteobacteria bacterium SG_bin4]|nr:MAG: hypothetical protein A4S08_03320 [Proteobacteria bacterium SG_bin4]
MKFWNRFKGMYYRLFYTILKYAFRWFFPLNSQNAVFQRGLAVTAVLKIDKAVAMFTADNLLG